MIIFFKDHCEIEFFFHSAYMDTSTATTITKCKHCFASLNVSTSLCQIAGEILCGECLHPTSNEPSILNLPIQLPQTINSIPQVPIKIEMPDVKMEDSRSYCGLINEKGEKCRTPIERVINHDGDTLCCGCKRIRARSFVSQTTTSFRLQNQGNKGMCRP